MIRSIIFWVLFYLAVIVLVLLYFPLKIFVRRKSFADDCAKAWSQVVLFFLRKIHGIDHRIINIEKLPKKPCIIACQHQSSWETVVFHLLCKHPAYIYKKELLKLPFYGWYVAQMTGIQVDRSGGGAALKSMIKQSKKVLQDGHNIVIFPQGTRVPFGADSAKYPYQVGVAALYLACGVEVVPVALDSGKFWPKGMMIKGGGTITMKFLDPIEPGLKKEEFMARLEGEIAGG